MKNKFYSSIMYTLAVAALAALLHVGGVLAAPSGHLRKIAFSPNATDTVWATAEQVGNGGV